MKKTRVPSTRTLTTKEKALIDCLWSYGRRGHRQAPGLPATIEATIAKALPLARRSPGLTEDLPALLHLKKDAINFDLLETEAGKRGAGAILGFFLTLTRGLIGQCNESTVERRLTGVKPKAPEMFFLGSDGRRERELAERRSPPAATQWNYLMFTPMSAFQESFNKAMLRHYCPSRREPYIPLKLDFSMAFLPYGGMKFSFVDEYSGVHKDTEELVDGRILLELDKQGNLLSIEVIDLSFVRKIFGDARPFTRKTKPHEISIDKEAEAAYITLQPPFPGCAVRTPHLSTSMLFDMNEDDDLIGIEILHPRIFAPLVRLMLKSSQFEKRGIGKCFGGKPDMP